MHMGVGRGIGCIDSSGRSDASRVNLHGFGWSWWGLLKGSLGCWFGRKRMIRIEVGYYAIELEAIEMAVGTNTSEL